MHCSETQNTQKAGSSASWKQVTGIYGRSICLSGNTGEKWSEVWKNAVVRSSIYYLLQIKGRMRENIFIQVVASPELSRMKLEALAGLRGLVVEDLSQPERRAKGFMVLLEEAYLGEFLWFIPQLSVSDE